MNGYPPNWRKHEQGSKGNPKAEAIVTSKEEQQAFIFAQKQYKKLLAMFCYGVICIMGIL